MSTDTPEVLMNLSLARTALDDPGYFDTFKPTTQIGYAIDRIDDAIHALDTELHPWER